MPKPRVISLLKTDKMNNLFLNVPMLGRPMDVFVQCAGYDLKLPVNGQKTRVLDIFEETVLRMLKVKKCGVLELADVLCLEKDLVHFIIIRLQEKGLLEDKYTLSDAGRQQLDLQKSLSEEVEYQSAKIFIVKGCDVILPYVYVGNFVSEDIVDFNPTGITLGFGSAGNQKKVAGSCIRGKNGESRMAVLPQMTIKNAVRKYNRLAEKRKRDGIVLASDYGIESTRGEDIYFHMQLAVQDGNTEELLVSDGFVSNVDGLFEYIKKVDPNLVMRVQSKSVRMDTGADWDGENAPEEYTGKYPEIIRFCREIDKYIHKISEESSPDDIRQDNDEKRQVIINCYSMLEWAFYYFSLKNPMSASLLQVFKRQKPYENFDTIKNLTGKIGLRGLDDCRVLFNGFDGGRAERVYRVSDKSVPAMQTVLPMAIIEASENDNSELRELIAKDNRFISFINYVGKMAGDFRHDSTAKAGGEVKAEEIRNRAVDIITTILPDIQLGRNDAGAIVHKSNERLNAAVACKKALGPQLYESLGEGVQTDFRRISPDKAQAQLPAPYEYVQVLYRILQTSFYEESKRYAVEKSLPMEECIKKNEELLGKALPEGIRKVKPERYNAARRGIKMTLGAHFLVFVPCLPQKELDLLKGQDIAGVVGRILEYREHANDISLMVSDTELSDLRAKVINMIKILGGYYDD